jgi:hypothetical protein
VSALNRVNYLSKELETIFEQQISQQANRSTDKWKGSRPLSEK